MQCYDEGCGFVKYIHSGGGKIQGCTHTRKALLLRRPQPGAEHLVVLASIVAVRQERLVELPALGLE